MREPESVKGATADSARAFSDCLDQLFAMCVALEALADALPSKVDTRAATLLADRLCATLRRTHRLEETTIFPVLLHVHPNLNPAIQRQRHEHIEDEDHACNLCQAMAEITIDRRRTETEEIGYQLRCLFVALRRHLAYDRDHILPLYRQACET